jgi:hypothetical protein
MSSMGRLARTALVMVLGTMVPPAPPAWSTESEVVIRATTVEPHVLLTVAGRRVNFVKRVNRPVHVEFGEDPGRHHVFHVPATGLIWAIFHRPGTHPYVVHIYDGKTTVLHGIVEVLESPERPWGLGTCGAVVMEECVEP